MIRSTVCALLLYSSVLMAGASDRSEGLIVITRCEFDTVDLVVRLSLTSDSTIINEGVALGIAYSCIPGERPRPVAAFRCTTLTVDTVFSLPNAVFDTSWTIGVWKKYQGAWTPPDSAAMRTIRVASSVRQPVSYFSSNARDTVRALAGRVLLWKGPDFPSGILPTEDTVVAYTVPDSALHGFVPIAAGVRFLHPAPSPAFFLALKYPDAAAGIDARYFRLYKDSLGILALQRNALTDSVSKRISVKTFDVTYPYVILADTMRPVIRVLSDITRSVDSIPMTDSFSVRDNSVNLSWAFYRAAGGQPCNVPVASESLKAQSGLILCTIPPTGAQAAGIRAFLTVSDGVFIDTIVFSRRAIRPRSDATTLPARSIVPVALTAEPGTPDLRSCLGGLFEKAGNKYDQSAFRIFRWVPREANSGKSDKWVEYSSSDNAAFQCRPGALFWVIAAQSATIDFGRSTTTSLTSTFDIPLSARNWTDFGVPFGFNIPLAAVINASGPVAENLVVYRWLPDPSNRTFRPELVYGSKSISGDSVSDTLFTGPGTGYTVYNPTDAEVALKFPPVSVSMQNQGLFRGMKKRAGSGPGNYCIKVIAAIGGSDVSTVFCGVNDGFRDTVVIPPPPSFSSGALTAKPSGKAGGAIVLYPSKGNEVDLYPISFTNGGNGPLSARIRASAVNDGSPVDFCFIRNSADGFRRLDDGFEAASDRGGSTDFFLIAGPHDRIEPFLSKHAVPPSDRFLGISYLLRNRELVVSPRGLACGDRCEVTVFDLLGKCITRAAAIGTAGAASVGPVVVKLPSGIFVCKSTVYSARKTTTEMRRIVVPN